jgi:hypothetical protein
LYLLLTKYVRVDFEISNVTIQVDDFGPWKDVVKAPELAGK